MRLADVLAAVLARHDVYALDDGDVLDPITKIRPLFGWVRREVAGRWIFKA
jgi:hypothetical protein